MHNTQLWNMSTILLCLLVNVDSLCNECQTNYAACLDENRFAMCTRGKPESKIYTCPNGYVCTRKTSICLPQSDTNPVTPSCEMTCGLCNSPGNLFSCLSNTTYAFCFGEDVPDLSAKGECPDGYVCSLRSSEVCKKVTTDLPSCNAVLEQKHSTTSPGTSGSFITTLQPNYKKTTSKMGGIATTTEVTSYKPTTTIEATSSKPTTTIEITSLTPPTKIEVTSLKPTTTIEVTSVKPTTSIEVTSIKPTTTIEITSPTKIEVTSLKPTTTIEVTSIKPTTSMVDVSVTRSSESTLPTTQKSEHESSFCKEKRAEGPYALQNDPTCQKFILCYVLAGQYLELLYTCTGSDYFNERTKNCQTEKPLNCL